MMSIVARDGIRDGFWKQRRSSGCGLLGSMERVEEESGDTWIEELQYTKLKYTQGVEGGACMHGSGPNHTYLPSGVV